MIEGSFFESILGVDVSKRLTDGSVHIRLQRSDDEENWVEAALAFYKQGLTNHQECVSACTVNQQLMLVELKGGFLLLCLLIWLKQNQTLVCLRDHQLSCNQHLRPQSCPWEC